MNAAAEIKEPGWFIRAATDLVKHPGYPKLPGNYVKVYLYIASRQNYRTLKSKASVRKTAEKCGLSTTTVISALRLLEKWGALKINRTYHEPSEVEIIKHFCMTSPVECSSATEHHSKTQKRAISGRFVPALRNTGVPAPRNARRSSATASLQTSSLQTSHFQNPPPPPTGGNGRSSETSARPAHTFTESPIEENTKQEDEERRRRAKMDRVMREKLAR